MITYFRAVLLLSLFLIVSSTHATRMDCTDGLTSELPVKFKLTVPEFLYFQVGRVDQEEEVIFDLTDTVSSNAPYFGSNFPPSHSNKLAKTTHGSANKGEMDVVIRSNCGAVKIGYDISDSNGLVSNNGQYIAYDTIKTSSSDANFPAPELGNQADNIVQLGATSYGVVTNRNAKWTYTYTNSKLPMAGTYQGTVSYQAVCP